MPPPIEGAKEYFTRLGEGDVAEDIRWVTQAPVALDADDVSDAFRPPEINWDVKEEIIYGHERLILAIVTHDSHGANMMGWIPQIEKTPKVPDRTILATFGIEKIENFQHLKGISGILHRDPVPSTKMRLHDIEGEWVFEGYNRRNSSSFNSLRETLWAIAMLPKSVINEAFKNPSFLLVSENVGRVEKKGITKISRGLNCILVENLSDTPHSAVFEEGKIEKNTPVVLFRYC